MKKVLLVGLLFMGGFSLYAQINVGKLLKNRAENNVADLLKKEPPITTSLSDVRMDGSLDENFGNDSVYLPITRLESSNGVFVLQPGFYRYQSQSYCLKAGTHGPGSGDGYMFAPPLGPKEALVKTIVRNSVNHPNLPQQDIQVLLWAIIARTKFVDLQPKIKLVASTLLTPQELLELEGGVLGVVPDAVLNKAIRALPQPVQQVMIAENKLRGMLTSASSSYADLERIAVLTGVAPMGEGSIPIASGRWTLHPYGYYVRYIPSGYSSTKLEIWVPRESQAVGKEFDPSQHIAVPGNTSKQRLLQSARIRANE
jgi:hypothetical protein